ncbi:MAG: oxidoreductase, partial [Acidimicrobiia bacterium]|nr:oxidoreductase [Acidimicrobiia bacterium]
MTVIDSAPSGMAAELVERARRLAPVLRERSVATNASRRLPRETIDDLRAAGVLKVLQSPRNGGYGLSMRDHLDVNAALGEGCGSTAWVVGVTHAHSWMMSHFPAEAQEATYGMNPDAFISAVIGPRGRAVRTDGGWRLSGVWPFASGSENADWLFLGAMMVDGDQDRGPAEFLLPASSATYRDDWHTTGLTGTGSCTLEVHDLFVPDAFHLPMVELATGASPGAVLQTEGWNHRAAAIPVLILALAGPALGIARRALADFPSVIGKKTIAYTDTVQAEHTTTHLHIAEVAALIDEAHFHLYRAADDIDRAARNGVPLELLVRARIRSDCAEAARQCLEAVE